MKFRLSYIILSACCVFLMQATASAQHLLSEGKITYKISLQPQSENAEKLTGTYTIIVKGKQVRKELQLDNGFSTTMLHDETRHIAYTLRQSGDKKYAVQHDREQLKKQRAKLEGFTLAGMEKVKNVAGNEGRRGVITYPDKSTTEIVFSEQWKIDGFIFDHFPGIQVLPLVFSITTEDGVILHFRVKHIEPIPVENSNFNIPQEYKIITNEEYRQLK